MICAHGTDLAGFGLWAAVWRHWEGGQERDRAGRCRPLPSTWRTGQGQVAGEEDGTAGHGQGWLLGADGAAGWVWAICSPVTTVRLRDPVRNNADSVRFR
jgi:hypothetical protein